MAKKDNMKLNNSGKERIKKRDGYRCRYCGSNNPLFLEIDHVRPKSKGGSDSPDNLVCSCKLCNSLKGSLSKNRFKEYLTALIKLKRIKKLTVGVTVKFTIDS